MPLHRRRRCDVPHHCGVVHTIVNAGVSGRDQVAAQYSESCSPVAVCWADPSTAIVPASLCRPAVRWRSPAYRRDADTLMKYGVALWQSGVDRFSGGVTRTSRTPSDWSNARSCNRRRVRVTRGRRFRINRKSSPTVRLDVGSGMAKPSNLMIGVDHDLR